LNFKGGVSLVSLESDFLYKRKDISRIALIGKTLSRLTTLTLCGVLGLGSPSWRVSGG
jgi:hypothetical protein